MSAETLIDVPVRLRPVAEGQEAPVMVVRGEPTACPHLAVVPASGTGDAGAERYTGGWSLAHLPSGLRIPGPLGADPTDLRLLAERLADMDWSSPDPTDYEVHRERVMAEIRRMEEVTPNHSEDPGRIPETATELIRWLLGSFGRFDHGTWENLPDEKCRLLSVVAQVDRYGLIWCLAALQRTDPRAADSAAAMLSRAWESGDSMGEWVWQWAKEMDEGRPLTLRGLPSPPAAAVLVPHAAEARP